MFLKKQELGRSHPRHRMRQVPGRSQRHCKALQKVLGKEGDFALVEAYFLGGVFRR